MNNMSEMRVIRCSSCSCCGSGDGMGFSHVLFHNLVNDCPTEAVPGSGWLSLLISSVVITVIHDRWQFNSKLLVFKLSLHATSRKGRIYQMSCKPKNRQPFSDRHKSKTKAPNDIFCVWISNWMSDIDKETLPILKKFIEGKTIVIMPAAANLAQFECKQKNRLPMKHGQMCKMQKWILSVFREYPATAMNDFRLSGLVSPSALIEWLCLLTHNYCSAYHEMQMEIN